MGDRGGSDCACFATRVPSVGWVSPPLPFWGTAQREAGSAPGLACVLKGQVNVTAHVQETN